MAGRNVTSTALPRNRTEALQNIKIEIPANPAIPLLSTQPPDMKSQVRAVCTPVDHTSRTIARLSLLRINVKPIETHKHSEYYSVLKMKILSFDTT